jgi:hypothetical protein
MTIAKKTGKIVLRVFGILIGLILIGYLIVLGVNLQDRPASESVAQMEQASASIQQVDDDLNAYVYVMGFSIEKCEDPREWGKKRIAWAQQLVKQPYSDSYSAPPGEDSNFRKHNNSVVKELLESCRKADRTCVSLIEDNEPRILSWLNNKGWQLKRYKALLNHPTWYEPVSYDLRMPFPNYLNVLDAQMLMLAESWIAAGNSDTATVKTLLESDIRFWRQVLASSDILITKMIATEALKRHFNWSNDILRRLPKDVVMNAVPDSWSSSFSDQERSLLRCMIGEWKFINGQIGQEKEGYVNPFGYGEDITVLDRFVWSLVSPMLKPQEESNRYAGLILRTVDALQVPFEQYPQAAEQARDILEQSRTSAFPSRAYNITGDYLFSTGSWDMASYSVRVNDLEGVRRIAVAAIKLRSRGIPIQQVPSELSKSDINDPYTGQPFTWDAELGAIVFQGLEPGERGRHSVSY